MKVLYVIQHFGVGGAEVALLSAIPELNRQFNFRLVCLSPVNPSFIARLSAEERNNIIVFKGFPFNYLKALFYILKFKPDIVITSLWKAVTMGVLTKLIKPRTKYVEFIHSSVYFHLLDRLFTKLALKSADVVFCDSASAKTFIEKQGYKRSIEIISFLRFQSLKQWQPKQNISLKALYVGRFNECKRIDRLVLLLKELVDSGLHFQIDLYGGDDGTMDSIKTLIKKNQLEKNIFIKGEVASDEVQGLFADYDFYFQTSEVEGMAMSVVEAMQHGLIGVVTNVGEIRNYAKNGNNAIIINEDFDLITVVGQLKEVCNNLDLANTISRNAYLTFANRKNFVNSLTETLNKCV